MTLDGGIQSPNNDEILSLQEEQILPIDLIFFFFNLFHAASIT